MLNTVLGAWDPEVKQMVHLLKKLRAAQQERRIFIKSKIAILGYECYARGMF